MSQQPALLIDCHKIISWLEERRKLPKQWYNYEKAAEEKIKLLLKDNQQYTQPDNSTQNIVQYMKQHTQNFTYTNVVQFVNMLLKTKWAQNKSLVFGYSDSRIKQWVSIMKFMEKKQIAMVNIAKFISQALSFDLPSMDKNIQLLDNQMSNLKRKIDYNTNTIYHQEKQSNAEKNKLGLKLTNDKGETITVAQQIPRLVKQLPIIIDKLQGKVSGLQKFYKMYISFCEQNGIQIGGNGNNMELRVLREFLLYGNSYVKEIGLDKHNTEKQQKNKQKYKSFHQWKPHNEWGIQIQQPSNGPTDINSQNSENNQTILEFRSVRIELIEDLNQLLYFYQGIKYEKQKSANTSSAVQLQDDLSINLVENEIDQVIRLIQEILTVINTEIVARLQLKTNSKAYQILLAKFRNYEQNIQQMQRQNIQYEKQIQQMKIRRQNIVKELMKLRNRLTENKNQCEKLLSQFIKRQIRITGEINKFQ